jgi:predicted HTH domain antitoxin
MELTVDIPDKYVILQSPEKIIRLMKLNTAIDLYQNAELSVGAATEFVGDIDRFEFLYECNKRGVEPQTYESVNELKKEVSMLDIELA